MPVTRCEELPDVQVKNHADFNVVHWLWSPATAAEALKGTMEEGLVWMVKAPRQGWLFVGDLMGLFAERAPWQRHGERWRVAFEKF